MRHVLAGTMLALSLGLGCTKEPAKGGSDMANVASDSETLRTASTAVNEVLRLSSDCDAAKPLIPEAMAKLDEAARHVRTPAGQTTLDALRTQLRNVERSCP